MGMTKSIRVIEQMIKFNPYSADQEQALKDAVQALKDKENSIMPSIQLDTWFDYETE